MTNTPESAASWPPTDDHVPAEELVRRQGIKPITSVEDLALPSAFESDEELEEFLTDLYSSRRADMT
jgi:hypothetical protein